MQNVISGSTKLPFKAGSTWLATQQIYDESTRLSKKMTNARVVQRYLSTVSIARDGLLVVHEKGLFAPVGECIVIRRHVLPGFITALHIILSTQHLTS